MCFECMIFELHEAKKKAEKVMAESRKSWNEQMYERFNDRFT
jgi:hypothetical protein